MTNTGKIVLTIVVLVLIVIGLSYMAKKPSTTPVTSGEPIKIGFIAPLTGDAAAYGEPARKMTEMAVDEINSSGGLDGRVVEIIYEDGKCSGPTAVSAAQKLINVDKVKAIIGGFCSGESLAAVPVAEAAKVLMLSPGSSSPDLTGKSKFFFRDYPSDATQGRVLAEYALGRSWKKVAILQEQSDYALGNYKAFSSVFAAAGGQVIKEEFAPSATDFRSSLAKLKAAQPDALFIDPQAPAGGSRILKQLRDLNWKPALLLNDVLDDATLLADNKDLLEGAVMAEFGTDSANPKFQQMVTSYKSKYGVEPPYQGYAQTEYDAVYLLTDGIKSVGYDGQKLADWSRTIRDWQGASGLISIDQSGDRAGGHILKAVKNGKLEIYAKA